MPLRRLIVPAIVWLGCAALSWWPRHSALWPGWVPSEVREQMPVVTGTLAWLALAWFLFRVFERLVSFGREQPLPQLLKDLVWLLLYALAGMAILGWELDQPVTGLVATSGVLVAVAGFALRDLIGDIFSGIALNLERPYGIGDWLDLLAYTPGGAPITGRVVEINWRATRLLTADNTTVVVPNGQIARNRFVNLSKPSPRYRATFALVLDHDVSVARAYRVLLAATRNLPLVLAQPEPKVLAEQFTERGVRYLVCFSVADYSCAVAARHQLVQSIDRHLRLAGIAPPHQRQNIFLQRARTKDNSQRPSALLARLDLFRALDREDCERLGEELTALTLPQGAVVVEQDTPGASLFLVVEGLLSVVVDGAAVATIGPGEVLGEMSLLTGAPRTATVVAATEATVFELSESQLRPILKQKPALAHALSQILAEREQERRDRAQARCATPEPEPALPLLVRIQNFFGL